MSSARSNAGARNRRAGGAETTSAPQNMNGRPGQPGQPPSAPQMNPRLSISDAIALVTLRLGRVENIIQNMPMDSQNDNGVEHDENVRMVDVAVFENIVSRLDSLEKGHKFISDKQQQQQQMQLNSLKSVVVTSTPVPAAAPIIMSDTKNDEKIVKINDSVDLLKAELVQVKDLLLKLQSFTMETNQKLADIVFNEQTNESGIIDDECYDDILASTIQHSDIETVSTLMSDTKNDLKKMVESAILESVKGDAGEGGIILPEKIDVSMT